MTPLPPSPFLDSAPSLADVTPAGQPFPHGAGVTNNSLVANLLTTLRETQRPKPNLKLVTSAE